MYLMCDITSILCLVVSQRTSRHAQTEIQQKFKRYGEGPEVMAYSVNPRLGRQRQVDLWVRGQPYHLHIVMKGDRRQLLKQRSRCVYVYL